MSAFTLYTLAKSGLSRDVSLFWGEMNKFLLLCDDGMYVIDEECFFKLYRGLNSASILYTIANTSGSCGRSFDSVPLPVPDLLS